MVRIDDAKKWRKNMSVGFCSLATLGGRGRGKGRGCGVGDAFVKVTMLMEASQRVL